MLPIIIAKLNVELIRHLLQYTTVEMNTKIVIKRHWFQKEVIEACELLLRHLKNNNKTVIDKLTSIAREQIGHCNIIAQLIVEHITKTDVGAMLPALYVIDSIVKNVGDVYTLLFSESLAEIVGYIFSCAHYHSNQQMQTKMLELRQTWSISFPMSILHDVDKTISAKTNNIWHVKPMTPYEINLNHVAFRKISLAIEIRNIERQIKMKREELEIVSTQVEKSKKSNTDDITAISEAKRQKFNTKNISR